LLKDVCLQGATRRQLTALTALTALLPASVIADRAPALTAPTAPTAPTAAFNTSPAATSASSFLSACLDPVTAVMTLAGENDPNRSRYVS
jgi:hypothetical protein